MTLASFTSDPTWLGLSADLLSAALFGTGIVPVKKRNNRDGVFTQWVQCCGIMLVGVIFFILNDTPTRFYPLTALGGAAWAVGNSVAVPIFMELGLGPAYLLPDIVNCSGNFAIGYFGLFGTEPRPPKIQWMAFLGLAAVITG